jgi:hypothetical protein
VLAHVKEIWEVVILNVEQRVAENLKVNVNSNFPKCKQNYFTWSHDDDRLPTTYWGCGNCGYGAFEDESFERTCNDCGTKTEIRLEDTIEAYWWCNRCNKVTVVDKPPFKS